MVDKKRRELVPFDPMRSVTSFRDEFDRVFDRFFRGFPVARWRETAWTPALDVTDEKERVVVKATLPGMDKNNLEIKVSGDTLVLTGKTEEEKEKKDKNYYIHEINVRIPVQSSRPFR